MLTFSLIIKRLPWILLLLAIAWIALTSQGVEIIPKSTETKHSLVLERVEQLGKLELVKYNFQEITELKQISAQLDLKILKLKSGPDSKAVLITKGEAVGCIDLTQIESEDIVKSGDSTLIYLPSPEVCYYKIDLQNSNIYDLELGYLSDSEKAKFIDQLYQKAEKELKNAALESGILDETNQNAIVLLEPLLESILGENIQLVPGIISDSTQLEVHQ